MEDKKLDNMLKTYFSRQIEVPRKGANCPSVETLSKYASDALESDESHNISEHVKSCKFCNELIEDALSHSVCRKIINLEAVPAKVREKVKSLNPRHKTKERKIMDYLKKNIWFMVFLLALISSFLIPRYFLQFLALSVISGLKWTFNKESTRTLVMIYNAWKKHDRGSNKDLDEIFKNRLP